MFKLLEHFRPWFSGLGCLCMGYYVGTIDASFILPALWIATLCFAINLVVSLQNILKKDAHEQP